MQSPTRLSSANALVAPGEVLDSFLRADDAYSLLRETRVDWVHGRLLEAPPQVNDLLKKVGGLGEADRALTASGLRLLGRLQNDLELAARTSSVLSERFEILDVIGKGSTSVALKAVNKRVGRTVVLKMLRPIRPETIEVAIERLGTLDGIPHLVAPIDSYTIDTTSSADDSVRLYCIVFPFVSAITLDE